MARRGGKQWPIPERLLRCNQASAGGTARRGRKRRQSRKPISTITPGGASAASRVSAMPSVICAESRKTLPALVIGALPSKPRTAAPDS